MMLLTDSEIARLVFKILPLDLVSLDALQAALAEQRSRHPSMTWNDRIHLALALLEPTSTELSLT